MLDYVVVDRDPRVVQKKLAVRVTREVSLLPVVAFPPCIEHRSGKEASPRHI